MGAIKPDLIYSQLIKVALSVTLVGFYLRKMIEKFDCNCSKNGRISFFMKIMTYPSVSFIIQWFMVKNRHDFYLVFTEKIKRLDWSITRMPCSCGQVERIFDVIKNELFWMLFMVAFYLPTSQVLVFVGFGSAERCYYPMLIGALMLSLQLVESQRTKLIGKKAFLSIALLLAARTFQRTADWSNDRTLSESGAELGSLKSKINLAGHMTRAEELPQAIEILEKVSEVHQNADINYNLGLAYQMSGELSHANTAYAKCLHHRPSHSYCWLNKAVILEKDGESPVPILEKCLKCQPTTQNEIRGHKLCQFNLARYYVIKKDKKSIEILRSLIENLDGLPLQTQSSVYNLQSEAMFQFGHLAEAWQMTTKSLESQSNHLAAYEMRAKIKIAQGTNQIAHELNRMDQSRLGYVLNTVDDVGVLQEACEPLDATIEVLEACGHRARELNDLDLALEWFQKVHAKSPKRLLTLTNIGGIFHLKGDLHSAQKFYRAALVVDPTNQIVKSNLSKVKRML